jgi:hypothetical protein
MLLGHRTYLTLLVGAMVVAACVHRPVAPPVPPPVRVLIVDGQNNHDWRTTTDALRATLEAAGRFSVSVSTAPDKGAPADAWETWRPDFTAADAVVSNYNGEAWPERVRRAFVAYVEGGGGVVMVHAANNPFPEWPEFNEMIGLGWRKPAYGDRITIDDATGALRRTPKDEGPGAGHGPSHVFQMKIRAADHPILRGLPPLWLHGKDQLSHGQRGPARNMTVLDSAFSAKDAGGTGEHEPMTWVIPYGKGRVLTTMLGHQWRDQADRSALECVGFQTVFARSVEWVATGSVTLPVPPDFPTADTVSVRRPRQAAP